MRASRALIPRGLPDHRERKHEHYLYAVEFDDGIIKIGVTWNPQSRLASLWQFRQRAIVRHALAPVLYSYRGFAEGAALRAARKISPSLKPRGEWFAGLRFNEAAHCIRQAAGRHYDKNTRRAVPSKVGDERKTAGAEG